MPPTRESSSAHRFETVRKVRRYEQVADQIRRLISDGTLKPGDLLPPERELAVRLGVGRSSVRDAVRTLEGMGILEPRQGHCTVVRDLSTDSLVGPPASVLTRQREMVVELLDVRRPPAHPAGDQAPRRQGGGEGSEPALERDRGSPDASALTEVEMDRLFAVEIVYRGIFQKKLAANISRAIVLAAHKEGKPGISFGRYGDSPERNGIPAKYFAIVATDETTLEEGKAKYEPKEVDISICVDDTLFKGVESWAWYGLQPINKLLKPGGTLIVTSLKEADQLIPLAHRKETPYKLAVLKGTPSFSGLWVYKDDHTDVRILGVMARVLPELFSLGSVQETIRDEWKNELKATSALRAFERVTTVTVTPDQGNPTEPYKFEMPKWTEMREGMAIPGIPLGGQMKDPVTGEEGGWRPGRNPTFKKWATRTMRPVVDFDKCIKCTLCWLQCPDSVFDVTPEGLYDANLEACCGCGVCEAVCPVTACVTMVNETQFTDNASQWEAWRTDKPAYEAHLAEWIKDRPERSHGFRFRGQYQQELPNEFARQG